MVYYVTKISSGRRVRLTSAIRKVVRSVEGEGYVLPDSLMYTPAWGIVPNTPYYRDLYAPAQVRVTPVNIAGQTSSIIETLTIKLSSFDKRRQNPSFSFYNERLGSDPFASTPFDNNDPPYQLRNLEMVKDVVRKALRDNTFSIGQFRPRIELTVVNGDTRTNIAQRRAEWFSFPAQNRGVGRAGFSLEQFALQTLDTYIDRVLDKSYIFPMWIEEISIAAHRFKPIRGGSYFPFCKMIRSKKAVINIKNKDSYCALWAYLAWKHPVDKDADRTSKYKEYMPALIEKTKHIDFPVSPQSINKLEKVLDCDINIYTKEHGAVVPLRFTGKPDALTLYYETKGDNGHYGYVKNLNRLISSNTATNHHATHVCGSCLQPFSSIVALEKHQALCFNHDAEATEMPDPGATISYMDSEKNLWQNFVVYADFESINQKAASTNNVATEHKAISFGAYISCPERLMIDRYHDHIGLDTPSQFLRYLFDTVLQERARLEELYEGAPMWTYKEMKAYWREQTCWLCGGPFSNSQDVRRIFEKEVRDPADKQILNKRKVRDHCHITGNPRGPNGRAALHSLCNFQLQDRRNKKIPVIFHNLKGYDENIIIQGLIELLETDPEWCESYGISGKSFDGIAQTGEKFKTFTIGPFKFIDSFAFLNTSLDSLLKDLSDEEKKHMRENGLTHMKKGIFPYEWFDTVEKLDQPMPSDINAYYSCLYDGIKVKQEDVDAAAAEFSSVREYLQSYQKRDVVGLADVFDTFRYTTYCESTLDPVNFISLPQLAFQLMLKRYGKSIELLTDPDMYLMAENGRRGGISCISKRFAERTSENHLLYLDANNLYGWAMCQKLPTGNYSWSTDLANDFHKAMEVKPNGKRGCLLTVDLEYPEHLHHRDFWYPLAETHRTPEKADFGEYQQATIPNGYVPGKKLMSDFRPRKNYTVHYRNLQFYEQQGLVITKVHSILWFDQDYVIKPHIEYNTAQRAKASSKFKQDLYKLLNNACFGKTMEDVRGRTKVKVASNADEQQKAQNNSLLQHVNVLSPSFIINLLKKPKVVLDKPMLIGQAILDLSKLLMHSFYYEMIDHFGRDNLQLLMTDTDSLCFEIKTDDITRDLMRDGFYLRCMDTSNYKCSCKQDEDCKCTLRDHPDFQKPHPLYSTKNKKQVGFMKDEHPERINMFVGLASKCYSLTTTTKSKSTCKGVNSAIKDKLTAEDYELVRATGDDKRVELFNIKATHFALQTIRMNKKALRAFDDKRLIHDDGIMTSPYA